MKSKNDKKFDLIAKSICESEQKVYFKVGSLEAMIKKKVDDLDPS